MAITATTPKLVDVQGGLRVTSGTITFDNQYLTAGEPVTAAQWGPFGRNPDFVLFQVTGPATSSMVPRFVKGTGTVELFAVETASDNVALDEVDSTTDESLVIVDFLAFFVQYVS